jgi:hypothetical protein
MIARIAIAKDLRRRPVQGKRKKRRWPLSFGGLAFGGLAFGEMAFRGTAFDRNGKRPRCDARSRAFHTEVQKIRRRPEPWKSLS